MQQRGPIPSRLGRYEVVKHLASGGMADLLLARTVDAAGARQHVVIKRIPAQQAGDPQFVQMFLEEARIATLLKHQNIVSVIETAEDRGEYFFAMDYVHGEDLRRVLVEVHKRRDQVPIALVTSIVAGAAAGLHHAHKLLGPDHRPMGIVHRDVSPANILIGYDGVVRVVDFGIAKAALRTIETRSGTLKGKVSYMSPEQVTGKSVDRRSDVFALGIVLYELATARRLFKGENDFLTMSSIVSGQIPLPSQFRHDLPKPLESIIMTALALAPPDRFQSAEELRTALAEFTESLGMKMSTSGIADYMKHLFGNRAEPWLVDEEPTYTGEIDFDSAVTGAAIVPDPQSYALPQTMRAAASAPILHARATVTDAPVAPEELDPSPQRAWTEAGSGSQDNLAWMRDATAARPRRRWIPIGAGVAIAMIAGVLILLETSKSDEPQPVQMQASPPPAPTPAPEPVVEPEPDPAPTEVEPRELTKEEKAAAARLAKEEAEAEARAKKAEAEAARLEAARAAKAEAEAAKAAKAEKAAAEKAEKAAAAKAAADAARQAKAEKAAAAKAEAEAKRAAKREAARQARADADARRAARAEAARQAKAEAARSARKTAAAKKPPEQQGSAWDPNSMFAPK